MKLWALVGVLLTSGALAQSPATPFVQTPPLPASTPGLTTISPARPAVVTTMATTTAATVPAPLPLLSAPRLGRDAPAASTRVVLEIPDDARFVLTPTFGGLRVDLTGVRVITQSARNFSPELQEWRYSPRADGATVLLTTPFPLGLADGWRVTDVPPDGMLPRRLAIDLGATLRGGASGAPDATVRSVAPTTPITATTPLPAPLPPRTVAPPTPVTPPAPAGPVSPGMLGAPRIGKSPAMTRVVLDLPVGATYAVAPVGSGLRVTLFGVNTGGGSAQNVSPELAEWRVEPSLGGAVVTLRPTYALSARGGWKSTLLPPADGVNHPRLVLDLSPALADSSPLTPTETRLPPFTFPVRIVLDPGHGGVDPGAVGSVIEKVVTLDVAQRVRAMLVAAGADVVLTRQTDTQLSTDKVTDLAARAAFGTAPTSIMVSIHVNSLEKSLAMRGYGIETWWYPNDPASIGLATSLQDAMVRMTGATSRGLRRNSLAVLRQSRVPSALVEIGFASHPVDGQNLLSSGYLDRVSAGIAWGIRGFLLSNDAVSGDDNVR